jgi:type VI secretion system protein ImpH
MSFESATLTEFKPATPEQPGHLAQRFFGMLGPQGPMPLHFTEFVLNRLKHHRDPTFGRFLNIFNHRMLSLFYRAWANNEPTVSLDRPETDYFTGYIASLQGLGLDSLQNRDSIPDQIKYYFCGHHAGLSKTLEGLQAIISTFFAIPCTINEFFGCWQTIPSCDRSRLGGDPATGTLGSSAVLGEMVWSVDQTLQLRLGPLNYSDYYLFLPGSKRLQQLADLIRNFVGIEFAWDVLLVLKQSEVPTFRINGSTLLGWTSCLGKRLWQGDVDELEIKLIA